MWLIGHYHRGLCLFPLGPNRVLLTASTIFGFGTGSACGIVEYSGLYTAGQPHGADFYGRYVVSLRTVLGVARNDLHGIRSAWRTAAISPVGDDDA